MYKLIESEVVKKITHYFGFHFLVGNNLTARSMEMYMYSIRILAQKHIHVVLTETPRYTQCVHFTASVGQLEPLYTQTQPGHC